MLVSLPSLSIISGNNIDHGVGSTDHLSRQTMRIKTVMNHNQENDQKNRILW